MVPNRQQAIIWTNADLIHWSLYAALGGDELISDALKAFNMIDTVYGGRGQIYYINSTLNSVTFNSLNCKISLLC